MAVTRNRLTEALCVFFLTLATFNGMFHSPHGSFNQLADMAFRRTGTREPCSKTRGKTQTPQNKSGDEKEILPHSSDLGEGEFHNRPAKSNSCGLLADASGIFAGSGIDGYLFTNGDERRNGNNQASFAGGGFVLRRGGGTL